MKNLLTDLRNSTFYISSYTFPVRKKFVIILFVVIAVTLAALWTFESRSASRKQAESDFKIGYLYEKGIGVPLDPAEAFKWYKKAADAGLAEAQYNLGVLYYNGIGVQRDHTEALNWFLKAAKQGIPEAQFNSANAFRSGDGTDRDYVKAKDWYLKAARQGYAPAQFNLAALHENGEGTSQDYGEAFKWLLLADKFGYPPASKYLQTFAPDLKPEQRIRIGEEADRIYSSIPKPVVPRSITGSVLDMVQR